MSVEAVVRDDSNGKVVVVELHPATKIAGQADTGPIVEPNYLADATREYNKWGAGGHRVQSLPQGSYVDGYGRVLLVFEADVLIMPPSQATQVQQG